MKVNLYKSLVKLDGEPVQQTCEDGSKKEVKLNELVGQSIASQLGVPEEEVKSRMILAEKIFNSKGEVDLTVNEAKIIQDSIRNNSVLIRSQIMNILNK